MDRYSNKAFEKSLDQANEERRLNANRFDVNGNRKLYRYSRNLDDSKCFLPPVPGDERRKRAVFTNYGDSGYRLENIQRSPKCQREDVWEATPSNTLKIEQAVPKDWKEERRVRVENAMKRVEQSYVGELRHGVDDTSRYVRPDLNERPEPPPRKPAHNTVTLPNCGGPPYPQGEIIPEIKLTDDQLLEAIDLLIPKKAQDPALRKPEDEFLLDMKRQALLERKIREANEFQRKQRRNGQPQPVKEEKPKVVERPPARHFSHLPPPSDEPPMPTTPINGIIVKLPRPVPPIKPNQEESYSKRKRKLKHRALNANEGYAPMAPHQPMVPAPPSAATSGSTSKSSKKRHGKHKAARDTDAGAAYRVQNQEQEETFSNVTPRDFTRTSTSLAYYIPNEPQNDVYDLAPAANVPSLDDSTLYGSRSYNKAPDTTTDATPDRQTPIPRQASYNIWNGDTAKLGLGFKSKLRKEMEEASLRALEPKEESVERKPHRPHVTSDVAAKWKREMLKDF